MAARTATRTASRGLRLTPTLAAAARPRALAPILTTARGHAVAVDPRPAPTTANRTATEGAVRSDWTRDEVQRIFDGPLMDTIFRAASVHRMHHDPSRVQLCTLMNIKSEYGWVPSGHVHLCEGGGARAADCEICSVLPSMPGCMQR